MGIKSICDVGKNKFLSQPEFSNIEKIRTVFNKLESPELIHSIEEDDDNNTPPSTDTGTE